MNETNEGDISTKLNIKGKRKSVLGRNAKISEDLSSKLNIKSKRKSMMNKKLLFQLEENKANKETTNSSSKRKSILTKSDLKLILNDHKNNTNTNHNNKPNRKRKTAMQAQIYELSSFLALKSQLIDMAELIVQQESDIVETVIGCRQPNNYHVYGRLPDGELSYLYKIREYSSCAMRILCPFDCRGFNMKMKLVTSYENKCDNNFTNSLMQLEKNCKIPFLCLIRPDIIVNLIKEDTYIGCVEQSFSCCDPSFLVYNEKNEKVKYIEADCCQCGFICRNTSLGKTDNVHFLIYDQKDKSKPIGDIFKKSKSTFSIADSYSVTYPVKIPPEEKILLSFVAIMIDYQYF